MKRRVSTFFIIDKMHFSTLTFCPSTSNSLFKLFLLLLSCLVLFYQSSSILKNCVFLHLWKIWPTKSTCDVLLDTLLSLLSPLSQLFQMYNWCTLFDSPINSLCSSQQVDNSCTEIVSKLSCSLFLHYTLQYFVLVIVVLAQLSFPLLFMFCFIFF